MFEDHEDQTRQKLLSGRPQKFGTFADWPPETVKTPGELATIFAALSRELHELARTWEKRVGEPIMFDRIYQESGPGWASASAYFFAAAV